MDLVYSQPKSMSTLEAQLRAYSDLSEERAQRLASETFNGGPRMSPPITPREDWPHLDDKQLRVVEYRIKRLERAINLAYPLLAGETMDADGVFFFVSLHRLSRLSGGNCCGTSAEQLWGVVLYRHQLRGPGIGHY